MKYCSKCGNELLDEAVICPKCGCKCEQEKPERKRTAGDTFGVLALVFSIIAFVFGIIGLIPFLGVAFAFIASFLAILGLIFGIVGAAKAAAKGKCVTAIVFSSIVILVGVIKIITFFAIVSAA